ncbi:MAG: hypothetical protein LBQ42_13385 [Synergistaceae bacterium]|jgi:hypothetical protein|nr:hypothetical protein [Synergistaceae bacterium]
MLVNGFRKMLLALTIAVLLGSTAWAASKESALIGNKGSEESSEYTQTTPDRLEITYKGIFKRGNAFEVYYSIVSRKDTRISIEYENSGALSDREEDRLIIWKNNGNEGISRRNNGEIGGGVYINGKAKDYEEIVADQPCQITIRFWVEAGSVLTPRYKLAWIAVNGLQTVFKDVPVAP